MFKLLAGDAQRAKIQKAKVVVRSTGNKVHAATDQTFGKGTAVENNLLLIGFELIGERFAEADGLCGDRVHERSALIAREDGLVELFCVLLFRKNESASRSS